MSHPDNAPDRKQKTDIAQGAFYEAFHVTVCSQREESPTAAWVVVVVNESVTKNRVII